MSRFDMDQAVLESRAYVENRLKVRIKHPSFGYVKKVSAGKWTGAKWGADFTDNIGEAATFTCSELRTSQDANGNGIMALLVASYGGLVFENEKARVMPKKYD